MVRRALQDKRVRASNQAFLVSRSGATRSSVRLVPRTEKEQLPSAVADGPDRMENGGVCLPRNRSLMSFMGSMRDVSTLEGRFEPFAQQIAPVDSREKSAKTNRAAGRAEACRWNLIRIRPASSRSRAAARRSGGGRVGATAAGAGAGAAGFAAGLGAFGLGGVVCGAGAGAATGGEREGEDGENTVDADVEDTAGVVSARTGVEAAGEEAEEGASVVAATVGAVAVGESTAAAGLTGEGGLSDNEVKLGTDSNASRIGGSAGELALSIDFRLVTGVKLEEDDGENNGDEEAETGSAVPKVGDRSPAVSGLAYDDEGVLGGEDARIGDGPTARTRLANG